MKWQKDSFKCSLIALDKKSTKTVSIPPYSSASWKSTDSASKTTSNPFYKNNTKNSSTKNITKPSAQMVSSPIKSANPSSINCPNQKSIKNGKISSSGPVSKTNAASIQSVQTSPTPTSSGIAPPISTWKTFSYLPIKTKLFTPYHHCAPTIFSTSLYRPW